MVVVIPPRGSLKGSPPPEEHFVWGRKDFFSPLAQGICPLFKRAPPGSRKLKVFGGVLKNLPHFSPSQGGIASGYRGVPKGVLPQGVLKGPLKVGKVFWLGKIPGDLRVGQELTFVIFWLLKMVMLSCKLCYWIIVLRGASSQALVAGKYNVWIYEGVGSSDYRLYAIIIF